MSHSWSARIADRYRCTLSPELADWFDGEIWRYVGHGEFREPVHPEILLDPAPECIWPGLMCCDMLPIIGNTAGDWLCARIDARDVAAEILHWYHGGGDWIPWGAHLAEAVVFDAVIDRLPHAARRHAEPAEHPRPEMDQNQRSEDPILRWAVQHVPSSVGSLATSDASDRELVDALLQDKIAEVALRCELAIADLNRAPREIWQPMMALDDGVSHGTIAEWSFDQDRIPSDQLSVLRDRGVELDQTQDWQSGAAHAARVTELAPELAWAWDICGYAAERNGDMQSARQHYLSSAGCSVFTDQSIRFSTYWASEQSVKFSVARLKNLDPDLVSESKYFSVLCDRQQSARAERTTAYWRELAAESASREDYTEALRRFMAAAWDVGAEPIAAYSGLLERIAEAAQLARQEGRAELARTHRHCLRERYDV